MAKTSRDAFNPADRELCPDGACIGLIGPDGRCKVCGQISPSEVQDPRNRGLRPAPAEAPADSEPPIDDEAIPDGDAPDGAGAEAGRDGGDPDGDADSDGDGGDPDGDADSDGDGGDPDGDADFDARQLCPDGACVGLIGADGRCKVCGTAAEG